MTTAPSSQGFSQGGIRSNDWFSETLPRVQSTHLGPGGEQAPQWAPAHPCGGTGSGLSLGIFLTGPAGWGASGRPVQPGGMCHSSLLSPPAACPWCLNLLSLSLRPNLGPSISLGPNLGPHCSLDLNPGPTHAQNLLLDSSDPQAPVLNLLILRPQSWTSLTPVLGPDGPSVPTLRPYPHPSTPAPSPSDQPTC